MLLFSLCKISQVSPVKPIVQAQINPSGASGSGTQFPSLSQGFGSQGLGAGKSKLLSDNTI